ncbi:MULTISPECIES: IS4 family transposase [Ferrimicrobium]|uniref:IS4 family transposase n=1 Tax=Ferrimicrobium TaxID=121038 RepID=UPI0023F50BE9|nr:MULTISPECIES: IS4 family transposase [Ferrimicrobium]
MPRVGQVKVSDGERLTDRIAIGVLTSTFPPGLIDEVLQRARRVEQRHRLLPARVVVYFILAMCLWADEGYEEVARLLVGGLKYMAHWRGDWRVPTTGALTQARARLGGEVMKMLFEQVGSPISTEGSVGSWWRGLRLVAIDGTVFDLPDTEANSAHFGRPGSARGEMKGAFPQARVVALVECGTHAIIGAEIGQYATGETTLARSLFPKLDQGMLLLVDRGFGGYDLWQRAAATGAELCWRTRVNAVLPVTTSLADGSYLSLLRPPRGNPGKPITVRVIEYTLTHPSRSQDQTPIRLITTLLDHQGSPALELAALYGERWEEESAFDELKTHQRGAGRVLRSKSPEMVTQEIYAHLLVYHAVRALINAAAEPMELDPDRVSFLASLRVIRRQVTDQAAFSP